MKQAQVSLRSLRKLDSVEIRDLPHGDG